MSAPASAARASAAGAGPVDVEALPGQPGGQRVADAVVVLDQQDPHRADFAKLEPRPALGLAQAPVPCGPWSAARPSPSPPPWPPPCSPLGFAVAANVGLLDGDDDSPVGTLDVSSVRRLGGVDDGHDDDHGRRRRADPDPTTAAGRGAGDGAHDDARSRSTTTATAAATIGAATTTAAAGVVAETTTTAARAAAAAAAAATTTDDARYKQASA